MMTSMMLLFTLLTPNLEQYASEVLIPEQTEPRCDEIDRMFAKFDAEYVVERVNEAF